MNTAISFPRGQKKKVLTSDFIFCNTYYFFSFYTVFSCNEFSCKILQDFNFLQDIERFFVSSKILQDLVRFLSKVYIFVSHV